MEFKDLENVNGTMKRTRLDNGKEYAEVPQRIQAFRKLFPQGRIDTTLLSNEGGIAVIKASVYDEAGNLLAAGHAFESQQTSIINSTSYLENCETSAVGRALGFLGIGSETSIASAEEVRNAIAAQEKKSPAPTKTAQAAPAQTQFIPASDSQIRFLTDLIKKAGEDPVKVASDNKVEKLQDLAANVASNLIKQYRGA